MGNTSFVQRKAGETYSLVACSVVEIINVASLIPLHTSMAHSFQVIIMTFHENHRILDP